MLRGQEHTLDAEKEELLAAAGDMAEAPDDIFSVLMNADMKYPDIVLEDGTHLPLTNSTYISYMESPDRAVREGAFKTPYGLIASLPRQLKAGKILCTVKKIFISTCYVFGRFQCARERL